MIRGEKVIGHRSGRRGAIGIRQYGKYSNVYLFAFGNWKLEIGNWKLEIGNHKYPVFFLLLVRKMNYCLDFQDFVVILRVLANVDGFNSRQTTPVHDRCVIERAHCKHGR